LGEQTVPAITAEEVMGAVASLQTNKALGGTWVSAELLRNHADRGIYRAIAAMMTQVCQQGIPPAWNRLSICSIHKKGDPSDPSNYRGISLMGVFPKILAAVLLARLEAVVEDKQLRATTQAGFRKGARLEDNVLLLTTAIQRACKLREPLHLMFIDLTKAYDMVDRGLLWTIMLEEQGLDPALVGQLQLLYHDLQAEIRGAEYLGSIPVAKGLKQGCPCSPLLFSVLFDRVERVVREASADLTPASRHLCIFHSLQLLLLLFADDVALVARTQEGLERLFCAFREFCTTHRLAINGSKTHVMVVGDSTEQ
jgi:hypothetical protein